MKIMLLISFLTIVTLALGQGQYPFEKYPTIKFTEFKDWKVYDKPDRSHFTLTIPDFFSNGDSLTIQLTSFKAKWDSSYIRIFKNIKQIQKTFEPMYFTDMNVPHTSIRVLDVNGDSRTDIKLLIPYMGNGLASMNERVIYLFQKPDELFTKVSYADNIGVHMTERDFDGDNKFEIMTMTLKGYDTHSYWTFNIYSFNEGELINQNTKFDYPIMIQYLYRDNYKVTDRISNTKMKTFGNNKPEEYSRD